MITITIYKTSNEYVGFCSEGHADYAEEGYDIICAAVSVLTVNAINSIEAFTKDEFIVDQADGLISCKFTDDVSEDTTLLLNSMVLGLTEIQNNYGKEYIKIIFKEV